MAGDINCNFATNSKDDDPMLSPLRFLYEAYQFGQLITDYTRVTNHSMNLIDHLISNEPKNISATDVLECAISDHYLIYGIRKFPLNLLNKDIENLNLWLNDNKLSANETKTEFIILASNYID